MNHVDDFDYKYTKLILPESTITHVEDDVRKVKMDYLTKLKEYEKQGKAISKYFSPSSSLEELKKEFIKHFDFSKKSLLNLSKSKILKLNPDIDKSKEMVYKIAENGGKFINISGSLDNILTSTDFENIKELYSKAFPDCYITVSTDGCRVYHGCRVYNVCIGW